MSLLEVIERQMESAVPGDGEQEEANGARAVSRRGLFRGLRGISALTAMWAGASVMGDQPREVSADVDANALLNKLVRRLTLGLNPAETARATQLGYQGYLEYQLNATAIDDIQDEVKLVARTARELDRQMESCQAAARAYVEESSLPAAPAR